MGSKEKAWAGHKASLPRESMPLTQRRAEACLTVHPVIAHLADCLSSLEPSPDLLT